MGLIVWFATGLAMAGLIRVTAGVIHNDRLKPSVSVALAGAVLGGFISDLAYRGDSVANFRGPTLAGAVVGSLLFVGTSFGIVWLAGLRGRHVTHV